MLHIVHVPDVYTDARDSAPCHARTESTQQVKRSIKVSRLLDYLFSTSKKCIHMYAIMTNTAPKTARPMTSFQSARLSKPNALKMLAPGTSISRP